MTGWSNQQVGVKSAAGAQSVRAAPLSPSGLTVVCPPGLDGGVRAAHCPAALLLKCADELTSSRQIRTCYLKSTLHSPINLTGETVSLKVERIIKKGSHASVCFMHTWLSGWLVFIPVCCVIKAHRGAIGDL